MPLTCDSPDHDCLIHCELATPYFVGHMYIYISINAVSGIGLLPYNNKNIVKNIDSSIILSMFQAQTLMSVTEAIFLGNVHSIYKESVCNLHIGYCRRIFQESDYFRISQTTIRHHTTQKYKSRIAILHGHTHVLVFIYNNSTAFPECKIPDLLRTSVSDVVGSMDYQPTSMWITTWHRRGIKSIIIKFTGLISQIYTSFAQGA